ncbi:TauD/TfdA dioxygenase family protein [Haliangium sp.]|uniref:TauD/TfdA dioxygenase family protein n=1 Tax=Haliangium sp. TaxID=2663208 RepID=UPI003D0FC713
MNLTALSPFGLLVQAGDGASSLADIAKEVVTELIDEHRLVVFRGFSRLSQAELVAFARQFGPLLEWEFGEVLNLRIEPDPANHIFTAGRVELHWDGAYLGPDKTPRYNLFQCLEGSGRGGGETLFVDAAGAWEDAGASEKVRWEPLVIRYETEKKAHFGGVFHHPLIGRHPSSGAQVVRYIEPFNEDNQDINPVQVSIEGMSSEDSHAFLTAFTRRLYSDDLMYRHAWRQGDFVMVDNHSLLHGRSRFHDQADRRHLQRIHIL